MIFLGLLVDVVKFDGWFFIVWWNFEEFCFFFEVIVCFVCDFGYLIIVEGVEIEDDCMYFVDFGFELV